MSRRSCCDDQPGSRSCEQTSPLPIQPGDAADRDGVVWGRGVDELHAAFYEKQGVARRSCSIAGYPIADRRIVQFDSDSIVVAQSCPGHCPLPRPHISHGRSKARGQTYVVDIPA